MSVQPFVEALTAAGARAPFEHDGVQFVEGVPPEVLRAYAAGRIAKADRAAILRSMLVEWCGPGSVIPDDDPRRWSMVHRCIAAWAARCGELERVARGRVAA